MDESLQQIITLLNDHPLDLNVVDIPRLFRMSEIHRISGQLQKVLTEKNDPLHSELVQYFKKNRVPAQLRSLQQVNASLALYQIAKAENKPIAFLKGIGLSQQLYHDTSVRTSIDIDVLVSERDVFWFDRVLKEKGFQPLFLVNVLKKQQKTVLSIRKDIPYYHPQKKIALELHWRLSQEGQFSRLDYNNLLNTQLELLKIQQYQFPVLPDPLNFIYLLYHAEKHYGDKLHWIYDTLQYSQRIDTEKWNGIVSDARQYNVGSHIQYLVRRWKTVFPEQAMHIPISMDKKIRFYPDETIIFHHHVFIVHYYIPLKKLLGRMLITGSFFNMVNYIRIGILTECLPYWVKSRVSNIVFYFGLPVFSAFAVMCVVFRAIKKNRSVGIA